MNRSGTYTVNLHGDASYSSFNPSPLPPSGGIELNETILKLVSEANIKLAELNAASKYISSCDLFIYMYVRKEALISSQIEGTQCTLDDILDPNLDANSNLDVSDVVNNVNAIFYALKRLNELPICSRLLREIHSVLLSNVRGEEKNPGEFRKSQNWIGPMGCSLKDARYIPPNVEDMNQSIADLEKYINESDDYDTLIRSALIHYQFETIHPFLDGNGRIGRLLILLYFIKEKKLSKPILYISYFLKKNQIEYYDRMNEVRRTGNYEQWILFFLEAIKCACEDSLETIDRISTIHQKNIDKINSQNKVSSHAIKLLNYLEEHPIIDIGKTAKDLQLSFNTVAKMVDTFENLGILKMVDKKARNRVYQYSEYLDILKKGT